LISGCLNHEVVSCCSISVRQGPLALSPVETTFVKVADEKALAQTVLNAIQGMPGVRDTGTHIVVPV
jgi:hypothetical protein